jgi:hypothetical protein
MNGSGQCQRYLFSVFSCCWRSLRSVFIFLGTFPSSIVGNPASGGLFEASGAQETSTLGQTGLQPHPGTFSPLGRSWMHEPQTTVRHLDSDGLDCSKMLASPVPAAKLVWQSLQITEPASTKVVKAFRAAVLFQFTGNDTAVKGFGSSLRACINPWLQFRRSSFSHPNALRYMPGATGLTARASSSFWMVRLLTDS